MDAFIRLATNPGFVAALAAAGVWFAATALVRRADPHEGVAVALLVGLAVGGETPAVVIIALVALGGIGWLFGASRPLVAATISVVPALGITFADEFFQRPLFQASAALFAVVAALLHRRFHELRPGPTWLVIGLTLLGVFGTVPDTDRAVVLLGAATAFGSWAWTRRNSTPNVGALLVIYGSVVWVIGTDGQERPGAIVGALGCVGVSMLIPVLSTAVSRVRPLAVVRGSSLGWRVILLTHAFVVTINARVAGFRVDSEPALALVIVSGLVAVFALVERTGTVTDSTPAPRSQADRDRS